MERDESPASQPPIDDEPLSSPVQGEVLFKEDIQGEPHEFLEDDDMPASMKVSTAELLTQEPTSAEKEQRREVVQVTEITVEEQPAEEHGPGEEVRAELVEVEEVEDSRQVEEMDEVEP